jgi:hypothetical protein
MFRIVQFGGMLYVTTWATRHDRASRAMSGEHGSFRKSAVKKGRPKTARNSVKLGVASIAK